MGEDKILEAFKLEAARQIGFLGPFVVKKQMQTLNLAEETFKLDDAPALVSAIVQVTSTLFGERRSLEFGARLNEIVRESSMSRSDV